MLRVAARRFSFPSSDSLRSPNSAATATASATSLLSRHPFIASTDSSSRDLPLRSFFPFHFPSKGFASDSPTPSTEHNLVPEISATVSVSDEYNHEIYPLGDPKKALVYFVPTGGRFVYALLIRLLIVKFVLIVSAIMKARAPESVEVDLSIVKPGCIMTVKGRGSPSLPGAELRRKSSSQTALTLLSL